VTLQMNAGLLVDLPQLSESGASGIGLFRTELQFMIASTMPKVDEQENLYRNVLRQAGPGRSPSGRSISAATRWCPISARPKRKIRRLAGGRSVSRWTGPVCCAPSFERFEGCGRGRAQADAADGHRNQRTAPGT
jgi:hypothetical protein